MGQPGSRHTRLAIVRQAVDPSATAYMVCRQVAIVWLYSRLVGVQRDSDPLIHQAHHDSHLCEASCFPVLGQPVVLALDHSTSSADHEPPPTRAVTTPGWPHSPVRCFHHCEPDSSAGHLHPRLVGAGVLDAEVVQVRGEQQVGVADGLPSVRLLGPPRGGLAGRHW
jgi:hypothetical protein